MSFKLLKQLITHLRQKTTCPFCKSKFGEESVFVLETYSTAIDGSGTGFFFIICPQCMSQAFVIAEVNALSPELSHERIRMTTKPANGISINEVLDMRNFLKTWRGNDVKELFNEK